MYKGGVMDNKYSQKMRRFKRVIIVSFCIISLSVFIAACGDSDSINSDQTNESSNWGDLAWDEGNWG